MLAKTPTPPYYMVVFTSLLNENIEGYHKMADQMIALAAEQEGFLGVDSVRGEVGITVSYWNDLESIKKWGNHAEHRVAKSLGKSSWYAEHITRIAKVEREY